jgi:hypothetical protein
MEKSGLWYANEAKIVYIFNIHRIRLSQSSFSTKHTHMWIISLESWHRQKEIKILDTEVLLDAFDGVRNEGGKSRLSGEKHDREESLGGGEEEEGKVSTNTWDDFLPKCMLVPRTKE